MGFEMNATVESAYSPVVERLSSGLNHGEEASIGIPAALAAGRLLVTFLYGLTPRDPATVAAATAILFSAATLAAVIPAIRAARVDPNVALKYE